MKAFLTILFSFLLAMILAILPLPGWINWLRPDWIVLVLVYWIIAMPYLISVGFAWLLGLLTDVLFGSMLGEHALALVCVAYLVTKFHIRIRFFSLQQQILVVFVLIMMYRAILFWMQGLAGNIPNPLLYWLPSVTGAVFWPWACILLRDCDRRFKVSKQM